MIGWAAAFVNIIAFALISLKIPAGWLIGIAAEGLWIVRARGKGDMPDLVFISAVYCCIAAYSFWSWQS